MNRSIKIIIAIAFAIIYPVLTLLLALVVYPEPQTPTSPHKIRPAFTCVSVSNSTVSSQKSTSQVAYEACQDKYRQDIASYDADFKAQQQVVIQQQASQVELEYKRVNLALIAAVVGFILAMIAYKFAPITAGISAGSTVLVLYTSSYTVSQTGKIESMTVIFFSVCFVALVIMLFFVDRVLPKQKLVDYSQADEEAKADGKKSTTNIYPTAATGRAKDAVSKDKIDPTTTPPAPKS